MSTNLVSRNTVESFTYPVFPQKISLLQSFKANFQYHMAAAIILLFSVLNCWWTWVLHLISHVKRDSFRNDIEKARAQKIIESLNISVSSESLGQVSSKNISKEEFKQNLIDHRVSSEVAEMLAQKVLSIREKIQRLKEGKGSVNAVREELVECIKLPQYQALSQEKNCYAVNFLQILAVKFLSGNASQALQDYGHKMIGQKEERADQELSLTHFADRMQRVLNQPSFRKNAIWVLAHPFFSIHSLRSHTHPLEYNASSKNPHFSAHSFSLGDGKEMQFYYGPGITVDPLFEHGVLPMYRKMGVFELRFNHQDTWRRADYVRIQDAVRTANKEHIHVVIGFDKKVEKELLEKYQSIKDFFAKYRSYVQTNLRSIEERKIDNGLMIPKDIFSDEKVMLALEKAEEFCLQLAKKNPYFQKTVLEKKAEIARMMMLISDAFLSLGILYESSKKITPEMIERSFDAKLDKDLTKIRLSGACKQDVDRAVVENLVLRLFFRFTNDDRSFTAKEAWEMAGVVFGRARIVDDRLIEMRRYRIFNHLLQFIGGRNDGVECAARALKEYRELIQS
ncbi:MAG: hypothetical protein FJZ64_01285 [Chlamydiae bacterium]|nr:hypothetical protein [Chlamydiota bacterium]